MPGRSCRARRERRKRRPRPSRRLGSAWDETPPKWRSSRSPRSAESRQRTKQDDSSALLSAPPGSRSVGGADDDLGRAEPSPRMDPAHAGGGGTMARKAALVTTWSQPKQGREGKALESFTDFLVYFGKLAADGKCEEAEPFFSIDGGHGFAIVRGNSDVLQTATETEEYE